MSSRLIDGKAVAAEVDDSLKPRLEALRSRGVNPCLAVVIVGDDPASHVYVRMKGKACEKLGMSHRTHALPESVSEEDVFSLIDELNADKEVHGILCQLPLPPHIDERKVTERIDPRKDVDALHPYNVGHILLGDPLFLPATPAGIMKLLEHTGIGIAGLHAVVLGRSNIVGKPIAAMLMQKGVDATVTVAHSYTRDLPDLTRQADIIIAAVGKPLFVTADMVKKGAVVIDVGTNRIEDTSSEKGYRLVGDVDFEAVKEVASAITPSPGGVGPMTIAMLMNNTVLAAELSLNGTRSL
ncbi:MAG: methylenetetrahydrofolate dehydrogenase / methenyltetrahydrofolate cyclohydrolase [Candidatus Methanomethylophilaceae archaeon]|nr:methylenetetrahydrofolate dehydrogenase / methenyltetrahydrofolate cyclohydrolase [Candidatus Methanomethylophilaceae archaeon]HIJ00619.1 bifunctional methylenetetrahydrofolate dehydrogenase/methenyltetrahydrofolate cyclohydrolase FolD [Candidatus Methanomethylophilaceae archaeon]